MPPTLGIGTLCILRSPSGRSSQPTFRNQSLTAGVSTYASRNDATAASSKLYTAVLLYLQLVLGTSLSAHPHCASVQKKQTLTIKDLNGIFRMGFSELNLNRKSARLTALVIRPAPLQRHAPGAAPFRAIRRKAALAFPGCDATLPCGYARLFVPQFPRVPKAAPIAMQDRSNPPPARAIPPLLPAQSWSPRPSARTARSASPFPSLRKSSKGSRSQT